MKNQRLRVLARKCVADLRSRGLWRACAAEFLGTFLLVFFCAAPGISFTAGDAAASGSGSTSIDAKLVRAAFASGLIVAAIVWSFGHISGAHVNPAVSFAFTITGKVTAARALLYLPAQCAGSVAGGMTLKYLTPWQLHNTTEFGVNSFNRQLMHPAQAFASEFVLTFTMLMPIMASTDSLRFDPRGSVPLIIGLQVACCILAGAQYSGASMNPVRTLGPAVAAGRYDQLWIYIAGPISGAGVGAICYELLFRGKFVQLPTDVEGVEDNFDENEDNEEEPGAEGEVEGKAGRKAMGKSSETIFTTSF